MRNRFAVAPPSARSTGTSSGSTSSTSATWCASASSAARTRCARVVPRVSPQISPRASGRHCGAPRPVSAGTKWTPSVESTLSASRSLSADDSITPSPSRSHWSAAPPTSTEPSAANAVRRPGSTAAAVVSRPSAGAPGSSPSADEDERAGPVRRLRLPRREARLPEEGRLLVAGDARDGNAWRRGATPRPPRPPRRTTSGSSAAVDAEQRQQLVVPLARREVEQHRPRGVRAVGDVRGAAGQLPHEPAVDRPERELPLRPLGAREDPLELRRREVRVGDEPRPLADQVGGQLRAAIGGAPVLPDDRRVHRPCRCRAPRRRWSRAGS